MGIFDNALAALRGKPSPEGGSNEMKRAEAEVKRLSALLAEDLRRTSDLHSKLNQANGKLDELQEVLDSADNEYAFLKGSGANIEANALDKVVRAEADLEQQQEQIAAYQKVFDESRYAVALAGSKLKTFQAAVETAEVRELGSRILSSVTQIINATNDLANTSSGTGADLDKIAERYEQAKAQYEDSQGDETERKLKKEKQAQNLDEVKKRLEKRLEERSRAGK